MSKKLDVICFRCRMVRPNFEMFTDMKGKGYIFLEENQMCDRCDEKTRHIKTPNIKILKKELASKKNLSIQERDFYQKIKYKG